MEEKLSALYAAERARLHAAAARGRTGEYEAPVFGEGPLHPRLMLLGEAPGAEETRLGRPFVGKAGKNLNMLLALAGITRTCVYVTNAVKFRPTNVKARSISNRPPSPAELAEGLPTLKDELRLVNPSVVATLGNTPLKALCLLGGREPLPIGSVHGRMLKFMIDGMPLCVFSLYHPASVIYNRSLLPLLEEDVTCLGSILNEIKEA